MNILNALELQDHSLVEENDQLRAQVAALEAEVARLKEPVRLVWRETENDVFAAADYVVCKLSGSWQRSDTWRCDRRWLYYAIDPVAVDVPTSDEAKAACEAHHAARYREMQGVSS